MKTLIIITIAVLITATATARATVAAITTGSQLPALCSIGQATNATVPIDHIHTIEIVCLKKVPIVKVTLNGTESYFVLDSGSDVSLIHQQIAQTLGLSYQKRASKSIIGASGGSQGLFEMSRIDMQLGGQTLRTLFYATDLSTVVQSLSISTGYTISGIIGMDLMRMYGFEIDYLNQKLILHRPS